MKHLFFIMLCGLGFACGGNDRGEYGGQVRMEFSLDTVVIDPGDEILFLNSGLHHSQLSRDRKLLFNFNSSEFSIEVINLDELAFEHKILFDKEGPEGIGGSLEYFLLVGNDQFLLSSHQKDNLFSMEGKKIEQFSFVDIGSEGEGINDSDLHPTAHPDNSKIFYGLVYHWREKYTELAKFDREENRVKKFNIPRFEKSRKFEIDFNDGELMFELGTSKYISFAAGRLIIGASVSNELYVLDPRTDSISQIAYESQLIPKEKSGNFPREVGDLNEMKDIFKKINEDITYNRIIWDDERELFYRFSHMNEFNSGEENSEARMFPSVTSSKVFLTVFDKNLSVIAETPVPGYNKRPEYHFAKDGLIWIFENTGDEMGFVRMRVDF